MHEVVDGAPQSVREYSVFLSKAKCSCLSGIIWLMTERATEHQRDAMRLPLIAPSDLTSEQRPIYEDMRAGIAKNFQGFSSINENGALMGPWNPWLHEPQFGNQSGS
jgi:hypothetical protein